MELTVLNTSFETVYILDTYESLLWVDKFSEPGTFEIYTPVTQQILDYLKPNYYLVNENSDHTMITEDISIESDIENGDKIKIVGRSLESILDRRIVWTQTNLDGSLQNGIKKLLTDAIINPSIAGRKIDNFVFKESTDTSITSLTMEHQYTGEDLLDVIKELCDYNKIGFKITLNESNQFVFELYVGVDRSYNQDVNPYVIFSPEFDNVINSNYLEQNSIMKNVTLVAGEGEGTSRKTVVVGETTGLERREVYTDASSIQMESLTRAKYEEKLKSKGKDTLAEIQKQRKSFDAQCDTTRLYIYRQDFFIGDIVQLANEYGMQSISKVTEFTWSCSTEGLQTYPTFEEIEGGTS